MRGISKDTLQQADKLFIFTETIPEVNYEVPMSNIRIHNHDRLVFYIPDSEEKPTLTNLIEKYGGLVSEMHECFTYQIHPLMVCYYSHLA